ncbi:hypothetical protein TELCIR_14939 [Teladorsagia circumcincta]|uniref:Mos1 transposase HTH domain-containing protein n=1 Tax=Teladorsagia circumcincta TaxID=45464 RepID=A0A2G9TZJ9_TELCI|nr:hypothetical protein TELCIR_14939 [Teladorsagia circumcincta]
MREKRRGNRRIVDERVMICLLYEFKLGHSTRTARENLIRVYGHGAISEATVAKRYGEFRRGRYSLERNSASGVSRVLDDDELEQTVKENPGMTIVQLAKRFNVGMTTMWTHLSRISKGNKMTFIDFKKREQPINAERLIPGALPQLQSRHDAEMADEGRVKEEVKEELSTVKHAAISGDFKGLIW